MKPSKRRPLWKAKTSGYLISWIWEILLLNHLIICEIPVHKNKQICSSRCSAGKPPHASTQSFGIWCIHLQSDCCFGGSKEGQHFPSFSRAPSHSMAMDLKDSSHLHLSSFHNTSVLVILMDLQEASRENASSLGLSCDFLKSPSTGSSARSQDCLAGHTCTAQAQASVALQEGEALQDQVVAWEHIKTWFYMDSLIQQNEKKQFHRFTGPLKK